MGKNKNKPSPPDTLANKQPTTGGVEGLVGLQPHPQQTLRVEQKTYVFHSPVPPPEELSKFNTAIPQGAERIMAMAEQEQRHRHALDFADVADAKRGMVFAFTISAVVIVGGFITINLGHEISGSIFAGTGLASVIGLFIHGRQKKPGQPPPQNNHPAPAE